jgi:hypothetical protein
MLEGVYFSEHVSGSQALTVQNCCLFGLCVRRFVLARRVPIIVEETVTMLQLVTSDALQMHGECAHMCPCKALDTACTTFRVLEPPSSFAHNVGCCHRCITKTLQPGDGWFHTGHHPPAPACTITKLGTKTAITP